MKDIPDDIWIASYAAWADSEYTNSRLPIARAIHAERKRCDLAVWKELSGTPAFAEPMVLAQAAIRGVRI